MATHLLSPTKAFSARRAFAAFKKLQALTTDVDARKELIEAGVSQRRIEALYPSDFSSLIPAICQHLGRPSEDEVFNVVEAAQLLFANVSLFPEDVNDEIKALARQLYPSPEFKLLREAIEERFPMTQRQIEDAGESRLAVIAAYTFWMMERRGRMEREGQLQGVYDLFYQTYTYLIPELAD